VKEFPLKPRDIMINQWVLRNKFKTRAFDDYPTNVLKDPYQYVVAMQCRLYKEPDAKTN
jgi:hypothetical protein